MSDFLILILDGMPQYAVMLIMLTVSVLAMYRVLLSQFEQRIIGLEKQNDHWRIQHQECERRREDLTKEILLLHNMLKER